MPTHYAIEIIKRTLRFKFRAGTSRGVYTERTVWYLKLTDTERPGQVGWGECAPLPDLSCDASPAYAQVLADMCQQVTEEGRLDFAALAPYPSILMGLETAFANLQSEGSWAFHTNAFTRGEQGIAINGLVWMGAFDVMAKRIEEKIAQGFRCVKLKIGAIAFEDELTLLRKIRKRFTPADIELRVDANGAFSPAEVRQKLTRLSALDLHSIEQPIRAGQWELMAQLCQESPLPIALDEELIGHHTLTEKQHLLDTIHPQYLVLKPTLHGGFKGSDEWKAEAEKRHIGWWATSALESNIGLNAIAQWCAPLELKRTQGLGTGLLFEENVASPLVIKKDKLWFNPAKNIPLKDL